jgi:glycosyltransferase involved in cell wall biosynthesis
MSRTLLVIPHYNDVVRLRPFLIELQRTLPGHFSILLSDDGSSSDQREKLTLLCDELKRHRDPSAPELLMPLFVNRNTGKGGAVYRGWQNSEGCSLIAFADADGAVSASEIVRAESFFRSVVSDTDALFGSRVKILGRSIQRHFVRHLAGRIFATLVSELTKIPVYDTQCGLKIIKKEAYQKIEPYHSSEGFAFDVELLLLLLNSGAKVIEFPVDWHDVEGSKVCLMHDSISMAFEIIKIRSRVHKIS